MMNIWRVLYHKSSLCLIVLALSSGCGMWINDTIEITADDLTASDPFDGSEVHPLNVVVLGSGNCVKRLDAPLRALASKMDGKSQHEVIRAADCGMLAMYANNTQLAVRGIDRALALSKGAMAGDSEVGKISAVSGVERNKVFAGEPHEVASLYISRGLLYLARGDPENAKACFDQASLVDAMAEKDESRCNWLTADILAALSFRLYNDVRFNDRCEMIRKTYSQVPDKNGWVDESSLANLKAENLTIVVVAVGSPPVKYGRGKLDYVEGVSRIHSVSVMNSAAWMTDNVYVQAVTRGRRRMDDILTARQRTRKDAETVGSVALGVAAAAGGLPGLVIQLVAGAIIDNAQKIDVNADNRHVSAVPGNFYVWAGNDVRPGRELLIELNNEGQEVIARGSIVIPQRQSRTPNVVVAWFPR
jgi:hypothetical protein